MIKFLANMQNSLEHAKHKFDAAANTTRYRKALSILHETRDPSLFLYDDYTEKCFFAMQLILKCLLCKFFTAFPWKKIRGRVAKNLFKNVQINFPAIKVPLIKIYSFSINLKKLQSQDYFSFKNFN